MTTSRDYSKGKIYKIEPICEHEEADIYIGSTTKEYLIQRMAKHKESYNQWKKGQTGKQRQMTSCGLFEKYGVNNFIITLIESVSANTKDELLAREAYYIQNLKCVNRNIPRRTAKEWFQTEKGKQSLRKSQSRIKICDCGCEIQSSDLARHKKTKKHINLMDAKLSETTN